MAVDWRRAFKARIGDVNTYLVPVLLVAVMLGALFQGVTAGEEAPTQATHHGEEHGPGPQEGGSPEPLVIGEYEHNGVIEPLTEHHVQDHPQGLRIRGPPGSTMLWIETWFLLDTMGGWSTASPFTLDDQGRIEIDRQNVIIKALELGEQSVFTLGSSDTLEFEDRPMWVNITANDDGFVLGLQDGAPDGQKVYLSKQLLHEKGIHWPVVTHEDNTTLDPRESDDGQGFWVSVHHFSNITIESSEFKILERRNGIVLPYQGAPLWDPETNDLYVEITQKFSTVEILLEMAWFEAFMPYKGLKNHTWIEEEYQGHWFYTVELNPSDTPTTLHFLQYRPVDDWVYTLGNPENLYVNPFDEQAQGSLGPIMVKVHKDDEGARISLEPGPHEAYDVLVAQSWLDGIVEELPVFETLASHGTWNTTAQSPLSTTDWLTHHEGPEVFRVRDSLTGALMIPDYQAVPEGIVRSVDVCLERHMVVITNGTMTHEGPACLSGQRVLDLADLANETHWRYDPVHDGAVSSAKACAVLVEATSGGELYWAGSPCRDYVSPSGSNPGFLASLCTSAPWGLRSHEAFCGDGLSRYQAAGMHMNISDEKAAVLGDLMLYNEGIWGSLNEMLGNETLKTEQEWLKELGGFLRWLRLDAPCQEGSPFLQITQFVPDSVCGRAINEYVEGNQTVVVPLQEVEDAWQSLFESRPCGLAARAIVWLKPAPEAYCGKQVPMIHDQVLAAWQAVDWETACSGEPALLVKSFGGNSTFSRHCGTGLPNPDLSHPVVFATQGGFVQSVCYGDATGPQGYQVGDPVYLVFGGCNGTVAANDLRLTGGAFPPGSKVRQVDSDWGDPYAEPVQEVGFRFLDLDGSGVPGPGDSYYLCIRDLSPCDDVVGEGWVRMTGFGGLPAGSVVGNGDSDFNLSVTNEPLLGEVGLHLRYWDENEDGVFNGQDVMYWTATGNQVNPSGGHVRLGGFTGTGGFGEILDIGMVDVVDATWYDVWSWGPCEQWSTWILEPGAVLPERLCGAPVHGLEHSLAFVLDYVDDQVSALGLCTGQVPLLVVDPLSPLPSMFCGERVVVEDPQWELDLAELMASNPCLGESVMIDHGGILGGLPQDPPLLAFQELCGQEVGVPGDVLQNVLDGVVGCVGNERLDLVLTGSGLTSMCGVMVEDPEIPDVPSVPNPCGDETLAVPADSGGWPDQRVYLCNVVVPSISELLDRVHYAVEADVCGTVDSLVREMDESMTVCGFPPELDPELESIAQVVVEEMPCSGDLTVSWDLDASEVFGVCGGLIGGLVRHVMDTCDGIELCVGLRELIDECVDLACDEVEEVVVLVGGLIGQAERIVSECTEMAVPSGSEVLDLLEIVECNEVNRIIAVSIEPDPIPCGGLECLMVPSNPSHNLVLDVDPLAVNLSWSGGAPSSTDVRYTVYVDLLPVPQNPECIAIEEEYCGPLDLKFGSLYFWQVKQEWDGNVVYGPVWAFTTAIESEDGWSPTITENVLMDYPGKPNQDALCRKIVSVLPSLQPAELPDSWELYKLCSGAVLAGYLAEDAETILLDALGEVLPPVGNYLPGSGGMPMGGPGVQECEGVCTVIMIYGFMYDTENIVAAGPVKAGYGDWSNIEKHYEDNGYDVVRLDFYGTGSPADAGAAQCGPGFGSLHAWAHARKHKGGGGGCGDVSGMVHDYRTDWRHLAYHVAWYINHHHSGQQVDVVAHSLGGLLIRYALQQVAAPLPEGGCSAAVAKAEYRCQWPEQLSVNRVVTLGTPHTGTLWGCVSDLIAVVVSSGSSLVGWLLKLAVQHYFRTAVGMCNYASAVLDVKKVNTPQPPTEWYLFGSKNDIWVLPQKSQLGMEGVHTVRYVNKLATVSCPASPVHLGYYEPGDPNEFPDPERTACMRENGVTKVSCHPVNRSFQLLNGLQCEP